jgi:hypothetical protein
MPVAAKPSRPPPADAAARADEAPPPSPELLELRALMVGAFGDGATDAGRHALVDATLAHADEAYTFMLAFAAQSAWEVHRVEDAMLLVWAAELHAQLESIPRSGGADGERMMTGSEYVYGKLIGEVADPIEAAALEDADRYRAARLRLAAWTPRWTHSVWSYMGDEGPRPDPQIAAQARAQFLDDLSVSERLVAIPEWRAAQAVTARCAAVMDTPRCCPQAPEAWARRQQIEVDLMWERALHEGAPWTSWRATLEESFSDAPTRELVLAALRGDDAALDEALRQGAKLEALGPRGYTPLLWVMGLGRVEPVTRLLDRGANPNTRGRDHWNPVMLAAATQDPALLHLLVGRGGDPNSNEANDADRAAHERQQESYRYKRPYSFDWAVTAATGRECVDNAVWLVEHGADPTSEDFVGVSALHDFLRRGMWAEVARWFDEGRIADAAGFVTTLEIRDAFSTPGACDTKQRLIAAAKLKGAPVPSAEWGTYTGHHDLDCLTADYVLNDQDMRTLARERSDRMPKFALTATREGEQVTVHVGDVDVAVDANGAWRAAFREAVKAQCDANVGPRMRLDGFGADLSVEVDKILEAAGCPSTLYDYSRGEP